MVKLCSKFFALSILLPLSISANAAFVNTVDIDGSLRVYGFGDANPFTYNVDLDDVSGSANFSVPAAGADLTWTLTGTALSDNPAANLLINEAFAAAPSLTGSFPAISITPGEYSYNFDTQTYATTAGNFTVPVPFGLPNSLDVDYEIFAKHADGVVNDVLLSITESGFVNPIETVSTLLNLADAGSLSPGSINGEFAIDVVLEGVSPNPVPEPSIIALLGLGLFGFGLRAAKKA